MSFPMDHTLCLNVHKALSDTLCLFSHINGPPRIPLLLLSVVRNFNEVRIVIVM